MVRHESEIRSVPVNGADITGTLKQILIGPQDGYEGYLRVFTIAPGGHSPHHSHAWYHANYVLEGEGKLTIDGVTHPIKAGSVAYIAGGKKHTFENDGTGPLKFICLVPVEGDAY